MNNDNPSIIVPVAAHLRPLKQDERVQRGDFVQGENQEFKPWEGLSGFRADTYVEQIYRRRAPAPAKVKRTP